uniref:ankyrin repeat domain-containing protein 26-like n=1 Tax=Arvicanthis niloticus TaxID=61156 RepID=UPI00148621DF|nr:ankyrin repeat domain-containing protein 26-like [Arvicanthis niloticus]
MKKFFGNWNLRRSSSGPSTSQRESFPSPDAIVPHAFRQLKSYNAFGKIHKAASRGAAVIVQCRLMLERNGVNDRDKNDRTMLHYACAHGHPMVAALLIEWNCDIDLRDSDNCTALIKVDITQQFQCDMDLMGILGIKMISAKCKCGADPNAKDNHGNTALHYAVWHNKTSMVNILLEHNADICIRNKDNFTPYTLARLRNNESLAKFLVDKRNQILKLADELKRLKCEPEPPTEDSEQPQVNLDGTSLISEEADKQKVIRLQSVQKLNDSSVHSSEDQNQRVVRASDNGNHSAIHVSQNLNRSLACTSANESQTEVPKNLMNSVVHEAQKPNRSAAARVLQKQHGKTKEQPVPVEENRQEDGLKHGNPKTKVESEYSIEDSEEPRAIMDKILLVSEEADKQKVIRLQSAEKLNDRWAYATNQIQRVVHASDNGNHSAIHVSQNLNRSLACTSANESQTEVPKNLMNSVVHEAQKPNRSAAALVLQKQHGKTKQQPVPVEENRQEDGLKHPNRKTKVELEYSIEDPKELQKAVEEILLISEEADKQKVIRLQSAEKLNDRWVHASEDQNQRVVRATENGNHSAIHVSQNLNRSLACTSANESQTEVPKNLMNSVVHEAEKPNRSAAARVLQKQHEKTKNQPVPVEENRQEDGLKRGNRKTKVESEYSIRRSRRASEGIEEILLVSEEADKQKVIRLQSAEKLNDRWAYATNQIQRLVRATENGNHSAIHVSQNLNRSLACTSANESQTEVPESLMNSVVHEAEKPNRSAAAVVLQKQHGKTKQQPVPVEENRQEDGLKRPNRKTKVELEYSLEDPEELQKAVEEILLISEEADKQKVIRLQSAEKLNDRWVHASEDQNRRVVRATENGNHSAIHVSQNLNRSLACTSANESQTEVPKNLMNSVVHEAQKPNRSAAARVLQKQHGKTKEQPVPVEENRQEDGMKRGNRKTKVESEYSLEDPEELQKAIEEILLDIEEADKQKVIRLQSAEKLNDRWVHASEDQNQRVVRASENGNHSAIHVSQNLNRSLACTSANESQTEVPKNLMNSVVHEAQKPNRSAAARVLQKQHGKTKEQPVPVEENRQEDGMKRGNRKTKVELEYSLEDPEELQKAIEEILLDIEEADKQKVIRLQSAEKLNDRWVHASEDQNQRVVRASENGNHSAIHVSQNLNRSLACTSANESQTEVPKNLMNSVVHEAQKRNRSAAARVLQKQHGKTKEQPVPVEENRQEDGLKRGNQKTKVESEYSLEDPEELQKAIEEILLDIEEADKQKVIRLQSAEKLNDRWVHASEDQNQRVVRASENGNHSAIHVSQNLNRSLSCISANESQTEVPKNLMNSVVHEAQKTNHSAAALVLQKQHGKTKEQPVPVEENRQEDGLKRLNQKTKVESEYSLEDSEDPWEIMDDIPLDIEEADKQKVIRLQSAEKLNDRWVHASEDQNQRVVRASENGNHSAIHVSQNLNRSLACTSANESQTEVPENLMNSVVHEAQKPNRSAAALVLQKQHGKTKEQPVPVEENQQEDGLKRGNPNIIVKSEHPTEDSEQLQVILDGTSLVTEEADKQKVVRLQSAEKLNDSWVHASEGQIQSVVHPSENENYNAIHVSKNLNPSSAYTLEKATQTEDPTAETVMNSVVHEAEKPNRSAAALGLQKQHGKTKKQPVPVEENQQEDRLKQDNPKIKVESEHPTQDSEQLQVILDSTSLVSEEADKQKVIRLQSAEKLNDRWVHASEDQIQRVVRASENGNHSAIHVSENLNPSSAYTLEKATQTEDPAYTLEKATQTEDPAAKTVMNSVVHEAEKPNRSAAALVLQKQHGKTKKQPVPVEENQQEDGLKQDNPKRKVESEHPTQDSEQLQVILDSTSLVSEEADKQKVIRLQSAEKLNDRWVHASEDQIQRVVRASENGNHSAIHVSENLNPSSAYTLEKATQTEDPAYTLEKATQTEDPAAKTVMNSVVHEAEKPNRSAAALVLQKQHGKTKKQPVPVEENQQEDGLKQDNPKRKVESEHPTQDSEQLQVILDSTSLVSEEADKQKVIRLQSAEKLNDRWVHASEDQIQRVVRASENGNHSAIHVSENLNPSSAYTLEKATQTEDPAYTLEKATQTEDPAAKTVMNSVVHEAEKPNRSAAALVLQKQHGKTKKQPVPVEENQQEDGLKQDNPKRKVESEHPTQDSEQLQVILDSTSLVSEEADKQKVIRLQSAEKLNDRWVHASEDQIQRVVRASENGNHSAIHVSENLNPSSAYTLEKATQTEDPAYTLEKATQTEDPAAKTVMNSVVHEAEKPNRSAAALGLQKQHGKTEEQPVPVEENREDNGSIKNTSNIKDKINEEVIHMSDSDEASLLCESKSEDHETVDYDTILDLVEQLRRQSKDSAILHKIWFAISSYKISMKRQKRKFEHVSKKTRNVKDHVSLLKKNLAVSKETIIELEVSKVRLQGEQSTVRLEHENSNLEARLRQNAGENEQLQKKSSEKYEKYIDSNKFLKCRLEEEQKKKKKYTKLLSRYTKKYIIAIHLFPTSSSFCTPPTCPIHHLKV